MSVSDGVHAYRAMIRRLFKWLQPDRRLDSLFAAQAAETPRALALVHEGVALTYAELDSRANRMAWALKELQVGRNRLVGVCLERSPDMIVALLAVLKAGSAYLPLDPSYPAERSSFMLRDSAAPVLISRAHLCAKFDFAGTVLDLDEMSETIAARPSTAPVQHGKADDLAYVIYTSGSTGLPKGVMLSHTAVALVKWIGKTYTKAERARVAACTSICFDPSVFEIFGTLCNGGAVILKYNALEPFAVSERPTMLGSVPTALAELVRFDAIPDSVVVINSGGERLEASLAAQLYRRSKAKRILNHYGPTEATTCVAVAAVQHGTSVDPSIGQAICGAKLYVLDPTGRPVLDGEIGELYIGGPTVSLGYLNRPDMTAEHFMIDPFSPDGGRMYRTGDFVRRSAGSDLFFIGRTDGQVKLRGFRVELGEIEKVLSALPTVRQAAVVIRKNSRGDGCLAAWLETDRPLEPLDVRHLLQSALPDHMVPSTLVCLQRFPKLPSGKIDRKALERIGDTN